jgi:hypothetical protein
MFECGISYHLGWSVGWFIVMELGHIRQNDGGRRYKFATVLGLMLSGREGMIRTWLSFHDSFHPHNDVGSIADELCCVYLRLLFHPPQPIKSVRWIVKQLRETMSTSYFYYWSPLELKLEWTLICSTVGINFKLQLIYIGQYSASFYWFYWNSFRVVVIFDVFIGLLGSFLFAPVLT